MDQLIDIHSHILPSIDDGAKDLGMTIQMLKSASDDGITQIILTPHNKPMHHNADLQKILQMTKALQKKIEEEKLKIKLHIGNELYYRSGLAEEIICKKACTLAGSKYALIEFGTMDDYEYIRNGIYSLMSEGYQPILAHVERYTKVCVKSDRVEELIKMGCYIQVNAGSIMGSFGLSAQMFTRKLLKQHLVHFVATDAHDMGKRKPALSGCAAYIGKKYGMDYREELFYENPTHVIRDEYI